MKKSILFIIYITLLLITFSIPSCQSHETKKRPIIKIGVLHIEDNLPFFVAEKEGLYDNCRALIKLIPFRSARERDIALQAGEIQGALADLVAFGLLKKGGTEIKVVSLGLGATKQEGRFVILSSPKYHIGSPKELSNIPIGVSQNTIIQYLAEEMLAECGLDDEQIKLKNIPDISLRLESLLAGNELKAALLPDPLATLAEYKGAHVVIDDTKLPLNISQTVIIFEKNTLDSHPADIKKILVAYQKAGQLLNTNQKIYKELIKEKTNIPKELEGIYSLSTFSQLRLPDEDMVNKIMLWLKRKNLIPHVYTYHEVVSTNFLP